MKVVKEIRDERRLENYFEKYQYHFQKRPPVIKLLKFDKGEMLNDPFQLLSQFYIIVKGSVSIYSLTVDGAIRYISKAASGTLLGDMEFSGADNQPLYVEATEPVFLRFVLGQLAGKLSFSAVMDASAQTLEEKVLFFLQKVQGNHEISSVNHALQLLHCSRRQLQRVLKKLCDEEVLTKTGRGRYRLNNC